MLSHVRRSSFTILCLVVVAWMMVCCFIDLWLVSYQSRAILPAGLFQRIHYNEMKVIDGHSAVSLVRNTTTHSAGAVSRTPSSHPPGHVLNAVSSTSTNRDHVGVEAPPQSSNNAELSNSPGGGGGAPSIINHSGLVGGREGMKIVKGPSEVSAAVPPGHVPPGHVPPGYVPSGHVPPGHVPPGHVLAVNYYEQQTVSSRNMFQLQCLAKHLGLAVVKPVMRDSFLRTPLNDEAQRTYLKFEDSFALDEWEESATKAGYAPLVEWAEFIARAPRDVILVQFKHPSLSAINSRKKTGGNVVQRAQSERYKNGCGKYWTKTDLAYLESKGFHIVQSVCFNFIYGDILTLQEFDQHLLGNGGTSRANVTVVMDTWRGVGSNQRVLVQSTCDRVYPIQEYIQPSQQLVKDAEAYVQTHLRGAPYVAVMGRLEMSLLTVHTKRFSIESCLQMALSEMLKLKKLNRLRESFLSIDYGKYGTKKWRAKRDVEITDSLERFVGHLYREKTSLGDWELSFENVTSHRDAGYVALLQKVIVTRARCILFVGGGAFQRHALHLYRQLEANRNHECLRIVESCTSSTKLAL